MGAFELLTEHVLAVTLDEAERADPTITLDGQAFAFFRGGRTAIYTSKEPSQLSRAEIEEINRIGDRSEGRKNKSVKNDLANSLARYFNDASFKLYEFGCGKFPLVKYFPDFMKPDYHGIDTDPNCLNALQKQKLSASDWCDVMGQPENPSNDTAICVGVYSMHFMIKDKFAKRVAHLASEDGFFVGNFRITQNERETRPEHTKMESILERHGMSRIIVEDPKDICNEYWIIHGPGGADQAEQYADVLRATVGGGQNATTPR